MRKLTPTPRQLEFLSWEFGVFFHFGIRTFYPGHRDWDGGIMPPAAFDPPELDCRGWLRAASEAGARYAILTAKHHDGFALWPSRYTDYSVAAAPWREGKGDVVADFVAACREYGLKTGLYYSPADASGKRKTDREYDDYFIGQLGELLTGYGSIDYLWFDGCGSEGHLYDSGRIVAAIRSMQPEILLFNMWDPDTRWIGNESGLSPAPCYYAVSDLDFSVNAAEKSSLTSRRFLPGECDCRMRFSTWFASEDDGHTVKSVDELMGLYDYSVGRGQNLLLNVGPDASGRLAEPDATRLLAFGRALRARFAHPLAAFGACAPDGAGRCVFELPGPRLINCAVLEEDLAEGQGVLQYRLYAREVFQSGWILVWQGYQIGHRAICTFPSISTDQFLLEVLEGDGTCRIAGARFYHDRQDWRRED